MQIALVHDWVVTKGGAEKCLELFHELYPEAPLYTLLYEPETVKELGFNEDQIFATFLQKKCGITKKYRSYLPFFPYAIEQLDLSEAEVILSSSHCVAKGVLTRGDQLHICYCHTPVRYAWDLTFRYLEEHQLHKGIKSTLVRIILHYLRLWDVNSANRVDYFIANSRYTADRIWRTYRREATVIYPPVNIDKFSLNFDKENYFLFVSRLVPYKKADLVIRTFSKMGLPLKVVGDGPQMEKCKSLAADNVTILGRREETEVAQLMANARALIFAADEDFGIVPVEAQACGTPVIAFGQGGATETVIPADDANWETASGVFFYEQTEESLAEAVNQFIHWEDCFDHQVIRQNAERFAVERFRQEITDFIAAKQLEWQKRR
jgi:glycosyltransferase involved in cell wall biosynthesis